LSVALNRPERSFEGIIDSSASSFEEPDLAFLLLERLDHRSRDRRHGRLAFRDSPSALAQTISAFLTLSQRFSVFAQDSHAPQAVACDLFRAGADARAISQLSPRQRRRRVVAGFVANASSMLARP